MSEYGRLETDPLFLALTRPAMLLGVTYAWFAVEGLGAMVYFINSSDFLGLFIGIMVFHAIGFIACKHEPRFVEVIKTNAKTNYKCMNKGFHGNTNSYDLY